MIGLVGCRFFKPDSYNDGRCVFMVHFPSLTILWTSVQRVEAVTVRCGCAWPSLNIMVTTYREKGMKNGFFKGRSAPFQPSKERGKAVEDESDRSLLS